MSKYKNSRLKLGLMFLWLERKQSFFEIIKLKYIVLWNTFKYWVILDLSVVFVEQMTWNDMLHTNYLFSVEGCAIKCIMMGTEKVLAQTKKTFLKRKILVFGHILESMFQYSLIQSVNHFWECCNILCSVISLELCEMPSHHTRKLWLNYEC